jgi:protein TonB
VMRVRIDRGGAVRYAALEESSGIDILDAAAIDMIRRANPMPAAPANYPTGDLIEFLIPITFRAPK